MTRPEWLPISFGAALAFAVLLLAVLAVLGAFAATPAFLLACIAALGLARLC